MNYLLDAVTLLAAAVLVVPLFQYLGLGSVLGFLCAGLIIGPAGIGLISEVGEILHFAELGVVFLLFIIGIELKPSRLWLMRRQVFGLGTAQVTITGLALTAILVLLGIELKPAIILALGLALSSTAFVLQLLTESGTINRTFGRNAFAILLLQDLAVVPLLALAPLLAEGQTSVGSDLGIALLEAVAILMAVILAGRHLLRPMLNRVATHGNAETFLATALLLVLGVSLLVEHAGMSMAMGAFLAGLLIADSEFRHQILADIQPFRGLLLGLFFMSVGMSVDLIVLINQPLLFLGLLIGLLAVKALILYALARLFGIDHRNAGVVAPLLAQGGEFGFVLFGVSNQLDLLSGEIYQQSILVIALSMAVTPLLARGIRRQPTQAVPSTSEEPAPEQSPTEDGPTVIIAGFGRIGMRIASILKQAGVSYIAVENRADAVQNGREKGYEVVFGDAARTDVLHAVGADKARLMLLAMDNAEAIEKLVKEIHRRMPNLPIYARGHDRQRCAVLMRNGASGVVSENLEASLQLARYALNGANLGQEIIEKALNDYRECYYDDITPTGRGLDGRSMPDCPRKPG